MIILRSQSVLRLSVILLLAVLVLLAQGCETSAPTSSVRDENIVEGGLTDVHGRPVSQYGLKIEKVDDPSVSAIAVTDFSGHFEFLNLAPGTYKLYPLKQMAEQGRIIEVKGQYLDVGTFMVPVEVKVTINKEAATTINPDAAKSINADAAQTINPEAAQTINPEAAKTINAEAAKTINPEAAKTINPEAARTINPEAAKVLDPQLAGVLTREQAAKITPAQARRTLSQ